MFFRPALEQYWNPFHSRVSRHLRVEIYETQRGWTTVELLNVSQAVGQVNGEPVGGPCPWLTEPCNSCLDWITSSISSQQNCNKLSRHDKISCKMNIHQFPKCPHIKIQLAIQQYFWVSRSPSACRSWMAFELSGPGSSPATEMPVDQAQADSLNSKDFTKGFKKKGQFLRWNRKNQRFSHRIHRIAGESGWVLSELCRASRALKRLRLDFFSGEKFLQRTFPWFDEFKAISNQHSPVPPSKQSSLILSDSSVIQWFGTLRISSWSDHRTNWFIFINLDSTRWWIRRKVAVQRLGPVMHRTSLP